MSLRPVNQGVQAAHELGEYPAVPYSLPLRKFLQLQVEGGTLISLAYCQGRRLWKASRAPLKMSHA